MSEPNPPAFPSPGVVIRDYNGNPKQQGAYEGMTLLDHFAGLAMQGVVSSDAEAALLLNHADRAEFAYNQANAMIKERQKWIK